MSRGRWGGVSGVKKCLKDSREWLWGQSVGCEKGESVERGR